MKVVIAEKPSVARELARVFGAKAHGEGCLVCPGYAFTWAFGHLIQLAGPEAYGFSGWKQENLPMLPEEFKLAVKKAKVKDGYIDDPFIVKQLQNIKRLFEEATEIIVATDAGREGELIFRYIYQHLKCNKPFSRLWISSQTDEAIKTGFKNLKPGSHYDTLFYSAQCRSEADWIVGLNATQALSIAAGNRSVLSLGRVQTPTLAIICTRYLENKNFIVTPYFQIQLSLQKNGIVFKATGTIDYDAKPEAELAAKKAQSTARVTGVDIKEKKETPPLLHDLGSLQQEANRKYGYTAEKTLSIAQALYENKLITYPRTGSRYIGEDVFNTIPILISALEEHPTLSTAAVRLAAMNLNKKCVDATKVTDHHALLITTVKPGQLSAEQMDLYDLVASRMLESFDGECFKEVTKITLDSGNILFFANGVVIKSPGWRAVLNETEEMDDNNNEAALPAVYEKEILPVVKTDILSRKTKPKPLFTEASLLRAMETAGREMEDEALRQAMKDTGLGTPATRASIIETLIGRDYVVREKKNLIPTSRGLSVYEIVKDKRIAQPELTGQWEKRLEEIRMGSDVPAFKKEIRDYAAVITKELLAGGGSLLTPSPDNPSIDRITCPACKKGFIKFNPKAAGCSAFQDGCKFTVWRNISGKTLTDLQLKTLILKGKTGVLKGFESKAGKAFEAALALENGKVNFVFQK
ncbi:type IA DNA topoisomerase [Mucilaginibacter lappiensis]|uniref:DNA topoisomerase n=1 Tax=Mucilaginibacter lappiensis TaxID=354630 RepID=A0A841JPG8_9SPHI|nr:type IA DNA topoisomerase [Mucilaginibacter lappiensis]MBB6131496.1 DNA topoisomerase-3 [Mucilaginibacter lappiensis]